MLVSSKCKKIYDGHKKRNALRSWNLEEIINASVTWNSDSGKFNTEFYIIHDELVSHLEELYIYIYILNMDVVI